MRKIIVAILTVLAIALIYSCSTSKNTGLTRATQAFKARYNTYYNGHVAFLEGQEAQKNGNKDNYTEVIPFFITGNKSTATIGKGNYAVTIEKCKKTIKQHSITKKPQWNSRKPKKPKDKIWLSQKEYNPFLYKAWFMMGEAQFRQGEYLEAASTFAYIQRLYFSKPNIVAKARLLEAKCYAEMEWFYDAEDLVSRASRDSFPTNLNALKAAVLADCDIRQKRYEEAIPRVQTAIKKVHGVQKARMYFLLGQLYHKTGKDQLAYKAFGKVYKKNPPYELDFNARIQQTEVMSKGHSKAMIAKLRRMARSEKNKDYLDQVYYAIGNIYLSQGDTLHAIWAYNDGVEKGTRSGIEKGVVMLHLGELYYAKEQFVKAQKCYSGVLGLLDKDREDYKDIDERSKILDELLPHATAVELQDSLQALARMDSVERMAVIKRIIEDVKKKEKEEAKKNADNGQGNNANANAANANRQQNANANQNRRNQTGGVWYFYNPTAITAGKTEFQKKWGNRELADDWRRNNKTVLADFNSDEASDSIANDTTELSQEDNKKLSKEDKQRQKEEEYANDPHRPEYYLKDIPFTDEQMEASNKVLVEGLYNSAVIYKDRMENFPLAERTFQRICIDFPDYERRDETYYNMFQLYARQGKEELADTYRQKLVDEYPDNQHARQVADPNFEYKGRYGKQIEDSLYQVAYDAFVRGDYLSVISTNSYAEREYPEGQNRARFMFINAMSRLERGERDQFLTSMRQIVEKYPKSTVSELAGLYVKGLKEGRLLASGKMDNGSIWERRRGIGAEGDSLMADSAFSAEKNCPFTFVVAYERDSVDENQLLYEVARYNFTSFAVRNFDHVLEKGDGIDMLQVSSFQSYHEAYVYLHKLANDQDMAYKLQGLRYFIISNDNLKLLMKGKSFADYFDFYDKHFDRVGRLVVDDKSLDEPQFIPDPEDVEEEGGSDGEDDEEEENYIF